MKDAKRAESKKKKTLLFDAILVLSVLLVSLSVFLIFRATRKDGARTDVTLNGVVIPYYEGAYAEVTVRGEVFARYALESDGEFVLNGGTNALLIKDGRAYMKIADCPDKTCITRHESGVWRDGDTITCLPNRVRVEIIGGVGQ